MRNKVIAWKHWRPDLSLTGSHVFRGFPYKVRYFRIFFTKKRLLYGLQCFFFKFRCFFFRFRHAIRVSLCPKLTNTTVYRSHWLTTRSVRKRQKPSRFLEKATRFFLDISVNSTSSYYRFALSIDTDVHHLKILVLHIFPDFECPMSST